MDAKSILKQYGLRPSKGLGQNFLIDRGAIRKIIEAADLQPDDVVLEIGPGLGALTQELAKKTKKVIAVEKDSEMVRILKETLKDYENIEIIQVDIRKSNFRTLKVVGNLPFYLTAPVIRQFLESADNGCPRAQLMVLVVQKEVAQRICARPPKMNLLAVSVQIYAEPKIIDYISKKSFWPSPEVDAAIIKIISKSPTSRLTSEVVALTSEVDVRGVGLPNIVDKDMFFRIVKAGFSQPRKQLANNLSRNLKIPKDKVEEWLSRNGIQPTQRAETITIENWLNLARSFRIK